MPYVDMWALGCVAYELCALRPAFDAPTGEGVSRGTYFVHPLVCLSLTNAPIACMHLLAATPRTHCPHTQTHTHYTNAHTHR